VDEPLRPAFAFFPGVDFREPSLLFLPGSRSIEESFVGFAVESDDLRENFLLAFSLSSSLSDAELDLAELGLTELEPVSRLPLEDLRLFFAAEDDGLEQSWSAHHW